METELILESAAAESSDLPETEMTEAMETEAAETTEVMEEETETSTEPETMAEDTVLLQQILDAITAENGAVDESVLPDPAEPVENDIALYSQTEALETESTVSVVDDLTKPLSTYTLTEAFLLIGVLTAVTVALLNLFKGGQPNLWKL